MTIWYIFNDQAEIISHPFDSEKQAIDAMNNGEYESGETPAFVDGFDF
jgi:hypothetical protein